MIDTKPIENALALTGKTMEYIEIINLIGDGKAKCELSIEKFCYYLLNPEFIEKYEVYYPPSVNKGNLIAKDIGEAIYEYQLGNEEPLTNLLSKI